MNTTQYLDKLLNVIKRIEISNAAGKGIDYGDGILLLSERLMRCKSRGKMLYICGNGGSAGIAQHMTADFMKNGGIRTYNLYGEAMITCLANDFSYGSVFRKQIEMMGQDGDLLIAISSSGESDNILAAVEAMNTCKGDVITLSGFKEDNRLRRRGDINIYVPVCHYGMVESIHNMILQELVDEIIERDGESMGRAVRDEESDG